ncbi:hypothetical protein CGMCC3_g15146 [Colletotrichum fructicola]|nr:uncharacterized protein CGMCC3_g15146 [Colletotrichum fructicola]KAE9568728.1 hypothetical protein CGMCC3_g15146 [Colletotrichum fructicola]
MAAPDEEESFRRFLEEMSGDSRDYGIRKTLDQRVRAYLQSLDAGRIGEMGLWYADDVILILGIQGPERYGRASKRSSPVTRKL